LIAEPDSSSDFYWPRNQDASLLQTMIDPPVSTKYQIQDLNSDRHGKWMATTILMVLIVEALFVWWMAVQTDREMRSDLLQQAQLIAQTINIERIKELAGN